MWRGCSPVKVALPPKCFSLHASHEKVAQRGRGGGAHGGGVKISLQIGSHVTFIPQPSLVFPLKPQDSFGECDNFFCLDLQLTHLKVQEIIKNTIRPFYNCFEWHIVMQYCPVANYHHVHNLWQSVRGDSKHIYVLVISWNGSISELTVNRALIVHTTL